MSKDNNIHAHKRRRMPPRTRDARSRMRGCGKTMCCGCPPCSGNRRMAHTSRDTLSLTAALARDRACCDTTALFGAKEEEVEKESNLINLKR